MIAPRSVRHAARLPAIGRSVTVVVMVTLVVIASVAAIGGYLWSLHVAAVHGRAAALDDRIAATRAQIKRLRMELAIRGRLVQQERWAPVLGLRAPDAVQYGVSGAPLPALATVRAADPAPRGHGYAPRARHDLDTLIGDILR